MDNQGRHRVLMIAYACDPGGTGEHWLGWGWAEQAAKDYDVELLTRPHGGAALQQAAEINGINLHTLAVPRWWWRATQPLGSLGSWLRIFWWQHQARRFARTRHQEAPFALVHQTTFHSFRAPFLAASLDIPSVWGPIAGGESVPRGFGKYLGRHKFEEAARSLINRLCLVLPSVRRSIRRATVIIVSNRTTLNFLPAFARRRSIVIPANASAGLEIKRRPIEKESGRPFTILYAGNCVARRGISLGLEALSLLTPQNYQFYLAGSGTALHTWKKDAVRLGISDRVTFTGQISRADLDALYAQADVFLFPSLRDSGGSGLLEAMEKEVPIVCLDWGGPGEMVEDGTGLKIPVTTPAETVKNLALKLAQLRDHPALRTQLATAAREQITARFSWNEKRRLLGQIYSEILRIS